MSTSTSRDVSLVLAGAIMGTALIWMINKYSNTSKQTSITYPAYKPLPAPIPPPLISSAPRNDEQFAGDDQAPIFHVVLTGGPCGGKSSALTQLTAHLQPLGYDVYLVPEAATLLLTGGGRFAFDMPTDQLLAFQTSIIKTMMGLEDAFHELARSRGRPAVLICDRGTMDNAAYMSENTFQLLLEANGWSLEALRDARYHAVVHLVTAADGAEKFYTTENNAVRRETPQQARELDEKIRRAWTGHSHLSIVDNSTDFRTKISRVVSAISRIIGAPTPAASIRKFHLANPVVFPRDVPYAETHLDQIYLRTTNPLIEARIERKTQQGHSVYSLSRKRYTQADKTSFAVVERMVSAREFASLQSQADLNRIAVRKNVRRFLYQGLYLAVIEYEQPKSAVRFLQLETDSADAPVNLPAWVKPGKEVTGQDDYSSYFISIVNHKQ